MRVEGNRLWLEESALLKPRKQFARIDQVQKPAVAAVEVVGELRRRTEIDAGSIEEHDLRIGSLHDDLSRWIFG